MPKRSSKKDDKTFFREKLVGVVKEIARLEAKEDELDDWQKSKLGMLRMLETGQRKIVGRL